MIPVEDFTGPTISEIQKFIEITDEARKEGEVGNFPFFLLTCLIVDQQGGGGALRGGSRANRRDVRVLLDLLLRHGALGRDQDHEEAETRQR